MSDILIKGMELLKDDSITISIRADGGINYIGSQGTNLGRLVDCKAIELPSEHGDIKDVSIILQWLNLKADNCEKVSLGEIIDYIENAPTIIGG